MPRKLGLGFFDRFPFGPALAEQLLVLRVHVPLGEVVDADLEILRRHGRRCRFGKRRNVPDSRRAQNRAGESRKKRSSTWTYHVPNHTDAGVRVKWEGRPPC